MSQLQETIDKLNAAIAECRVATSEAHAARKDLRLAERDARDLVERLVEERIEKILNDAVAKGLESYAETVRTATSTAHQHVIDEFDKLTSLLMRGAESKKRKRRADGRGDLDIGDLVREFARSEGIVE